MVAASKTPVLLPDAPCQLPSLGARVVVEGEGSEPNDAWHLTLYLSVVSAARCPGLRCRDGRGISGGITWEITR